MTSLATMTPARDAGTARLQRVLRVHFDPNLGTPYWLDQAARLGLDPLEAVQRPADLHRLGTMTPADLHDRPLTDFIPRRFHADRARLILGQTGGRTSAGTWTAYRDDEFEEAFVRPFVEAARHVGFPERLPWLYVGPSGPHIIGKAVRRLAAATGAADPFSIDLDPRWARALAPGSLASSRYLAHIIDQSVGVIRSQEIGVLFTTPAILPALAEAMTPAERHRIRGVHYGGMAVSRAELARFRSELFPAATHLSGYGNTLFGCCLELHIGPHRGPTYFPWGDRLVVEIVDDEGRPVAPGTRGRVCMSRLDETFLIVRLLERDEATPAPLPPDAPPGFRGPGLVDPRSPATLAPEPTTGLY